MRIAMCVGRYPCWSERFVQREVQALSARGHEIILWPCEEATATTRWLQMDGSPLPPIEVQSPISAPQIFHALRKCGFAQVRRVPAVLRALNLLPWLPDVIHAHFAGLPAVIAYAMTDGGRRPLTVSVHARDVWVPWAAGQRALVGASRIAVCNQAALDELCRQHFAEPHFKQKCRLVHHGLPDDAFAVNPCESERDDSAAPLLLGVGRFVPKKGFLLLLDAFQQVLKKIPAARLCLIGEGAEHLAIGQRARALGFTAEQFQLLAPLDEADLREQFAAATVLAVPAQVAANADRDGISNVILEAMAAGLAVVANAVGGIPEVVKADETGWLVPPSDDSSIFAAALRDALADAPKRQTITARASAFVREKFSADACTDHLEEIFREAIIARK